MARPLNKEEEKVRKLCIDDLNKLEVKYGAVMFRKSCNRKLTIDRQRKITEREIKEAEQKLARLKSGKPLPPY